MFLKKEEEKKAFYDTRDLLQASLRAVKVQIL